uniref:Putative secreted peptide n=1 Tax=Anopheles braziliensis TaxID=58242 RepID=A0A2M3ZX47_9DIPT
MLLAAQLTLCDVVGAAEQNVFRLQVRVGEMAVVQKFDGIAKLVRYVAYMLHRIRFVAIFAQKIENTKSEHLERDTCMAVVVERI